jgi:hypothetical protein
MVTYSNLLGVILGFFVDPVKAYEKYCEVAIMQYGEYAKLD